MTALGRCSALVLCISLAMPAAVAAQEGSPGARAGTGGGGGPGRISGRVVAAQTGQPIPGAVAAVRKGGDSTVVARSITGAEGRFRIDGLAPGRYDVRISHLGYAPHTAAGVSLTPEAPAVDLGVIRLATAPVALEGLEVEAERAPAVLAADRTIYSTKDMPAAAGGKAVDVLRNVPELEVDIDGKVSLRGLQSVAIHINGRPAPMRGEALQNFLQQFPADRIERIEVIPNPPAKYDAEGMAGIVNIVLKENVDLGLSGSLSVNTGTRGSGGSARLAYQRGPFTFFGGGGLNVQDSRNRMSDRRLNLLANPVTYLDQAGESRNEGMFGMLDLTAELKLGERETLWASLAAYGNDGETEGTMAYAVLDTTEAFLERYDRQTESSRDGLTSDLGLGFRRIIEPQRHELSVELRGRSNGSDNETRSLKHPLTLQGEPADIPTELRLQEGDNGNRELILQVDYTRPLGDGGRLEAGYRGSVRETENDWVLRLFSPAEAPEPGEAASSGFVHREEFHSAYLMVGQRLGRLSLQAGLRAERASTRFEVGATGEAFDDVYTSVFPSANLAYDLGGGRQVRLTYSKRIQRPSAGILNPYVPASDPLNRSAGNPYLKPKYTHSLGMNLSWVFPAGSFRFAPYYRRTVDSWEQLRVVDSAGVSTLTWRNVGSVQAYGATVTASLRQLGRIGGYLSLSGYREAWDVSGLSLGYRSRASLHWSATANANVRVLPTLFTQMLVAYMPARDVPQGRISSAWLMSVGARQRLWGDRAWVYLSVMDPFNLYRFTFETRDRTHAQTSRNRFSLRRIILSFSYSFGRPPERASRQTPSESQPAEPERQIH